MAFRSPLFLLGLSSAPTVSQGGFRTPIPGWNAGGTPAVTQGGFLTPLPFFFGAGGVVLPDTDIQEGGGSAGKAYDGHGAVVLPVRPTPLKPAVNVEDDEELALLAVMAIREFYDL